jgi:hypothetical protein
VEEGDETRAAAAAAGRGEGGNYDDDELIDHDGFSSGRSHEEGRLQPFWISKVDLDLISQHLVREIPTHSSCCISEQKCNATLLLHRAQLSFPI